MYNHRQIEKKWNKYWLENKIYKIKYQNNKQKIYILDMFPYPSGSGIHVGHTLGYVATDILARYKRLNNFNVFYAMGWDSFGLPAEQYAINTGNNPKDFTDLNIKNFKTQIQNLGLSYDWDKEIQTSDPKYYKNTQWIFILLYKKGLAEIKDIDVNWCEQLGTVLANEETLINEKGQMVSERGNFPVIKRPMKQWVLKITQFADKLIKGLETINWPKSILKLQKNWIYNNDGTLRLKDWVFARQRYWGEPFPVLFNEDGNVIIDYNLPIELPNLENIKPSGNGLSPLANAKDWLYVEVNGKKYKRETNTMPQWAGSCWYYLAYLLKNDDGSYLDINTKEAYQRFEKWLPVDFYVGGQEHAVLHLLYARFWHIVLYENNIVPTKEPFYELFNQGMILSKDNTKMSKSKGNVINPNEIIETFGADTLRLYVMFMGPIEETKKWDTSSLRGIYNFIVKIWKTINYEIQIGESKLNIQYHKLIKEINPLIEKLRYNVAISKIMVFINNLKKYRTISKEQLQGFLTILGIFVPFIVEELLEKFNFATHNNQTWPQFDEKYIVNENNKFLIVQINGKFKTKILIENQVDQDQAIQLIKQHSKTKKYFQQEIKKVIYLQDNNLINIVFESEK